MLPMSVSRSLRINPNISDNFKEIWGLVASLTGMMAFSQTILRTLHPSFSALYRFVSKILGSYSTYCYFDVKEVKDLDGDNTNELYNDVQLYLSSILLSAAADDKASRLSLTRAVNSSVVSFAISNNKVIHDMYNDVPLRWSHVVYIRQSNSSRRSFFNGPDDLENRRFTLRFRKKDRALVLESYIDYITQKAADIRHKNQERLLYTNSKSRGSDYDDTGRFGPWQSVPFKHPSTFDTLAMDPDKKEEIMNDLKEFAYNGKSYYEKTGRAWKRGYLLYGPPGTGKSSMIAAMANYLGYDIFDLELTAVTTNSQLRKLLMKTSSKSIIVIEDIDCSVNLTKRKPATSTTSITNKTVATAEKPKTSAVVKTSEITLSGLLNFTDGLWSCCGSERIFVFTTNHIEKLDPALLRSGRMDMHILMSYCSFESLKILLRNYLNYSKDDLSEPVWDELEQLVDKAKMTPADVSEHLIKHRRDKAKAVQELIKAMKLKAKKNASTEANGTEPKSKQVEPDTRVTVPEEEKISGN